MYIYVNKCVLSGNLSCEEALKRKASRLSACGALVDDEELVAPRRSAR